LSFWGKFLDFKTKKQYCFLVSLKQVAIKMQLIEALGSTSIFLKALL